MFQYPLSMFCPLSFPKVIILITDQERPSNCVRSFMCGPYKLSPSLVTLGLKTKGKHNRLLNIDYVYNYINLKLHNNPKPDAFLVLRSTINTKSL